MTSDAAILFAEGLRKIRIERGRRGRPMRRFTVELPQMRLEPLDRVALVGPSGSGKSTILSLLALATDPDDAVRFEFCGVNALRAWRNDNQIRLAQLRSFLVAYLPQRDGLLEFLSIRDNILCAAELADALPVDDIDLMVDLLGLSGFLDVKPAGLSGGQRQRAAVACALAQRPRLILADEPTAALDAANASRVMDSLVALADRSQAAIVLATHQLDLVRDYGFVEYRVDESGAERNHHSVFEAA